jgi:hypothetical protein
LSPAGQTTLLQQRVRTSGAAMVALEGPAELSGNQGGQTETQRAEPALPRARQKSPTNKGARSVCGGCEGNHQKIFSTAVATGPAATRASHISRDRRCNDSVRGPAGGPWNASGNVNVGGGRPRDRGCKFQPACCADNPEILIGTTAPAYIRLRAKGSHPVLRWANQNLLELKTGEIGEHYGRYRLHVPEAERAMAKSLKRYGQLSPVVVDHSCAGARGWHEPSRSGGVAGAAQELGVPASCSPGTAGPEGAR